MARMRLHISKDELAELAASGRNLDQIGAVLGVSHTTVSTYLGIFGIPYIPKRLHRKKRIVHGILRNTPVDMRIYGAWHRDTDELMGVGTADEICSLLNYTTGTFYSVVSRCKHGEYKAKYIIEEIEDDDEI